MNITYTQNGDYLIPNIIIRKTKPLGHYGRLRKAYLEMHRPIWMSVQRNTGRADVPEGKALRDPRRQQRAVKSQSAHHGCSTDIGKRITLHYGMGRKCRPPTGGDCKSPLQGRDRSHPEGWHGGPTENRVLKQVKAEKNTAALPCFSLL